mgnify:FL=1|jgi:hypothetical protein
MNPNNINMTPAGINYASTDPLTCDACESEVFQPAFVLRKVSALVSPTGKETIVPVQLFACIKCGHVNEDMYPVE